MRNIIITLILFSSITTVNFLSVSYLNKIYTNVKDTNCSIMQLINDENWSAAKKTSEKFSEEWHSYSNKCTVFVNHTLIDDISIEEHKLEEWIKCKNKDEALSSASSISFLIDRNKKLEEINFQNIF